MLTSQTVMEMDLCFSSYFQELSWNILIFLAFLLLHISESFQSTHFNLLCVFITYFRSFFFSELYHMAEILFLSSRKFPSPSNFHNLSLRFFLCNFHDYFPFPYSPSFILITWKNNIYHYQETIWNWCQSFLYLEKNSFLFFLKWADSIVFFIGLVYRWLV